MKNLSIFTIIVVIVLSLALSGYIPGESIHQTPATGECDKSDNEYQSYMGETESACVYYIHASGEMVEVTK